MDRLSAFGPPRLSAWFSSIGTACIRFWSAFRATASISPGITPHKPSVHSSQHVAGFQRRLARELDFRRLRATEAAIDLVAFRVHRRLRFADDALVDQQLHARVIARVEYHLAAAHQIKTRVAGMRPVGDVVLDDAGDAGGARRILQVVVASVKSRIARCALVIALLQEQEGVARFPAWLRAGKHRSGFGRRSARQFHRSNARPCRRRRPSASASRE